MELQEIKRNYLLEDFSKITGKSSNQQGTDSPQTSPEITSKPSKIVPLASPASPIEDPPKIGPPISLSLPRPLGLSLLGLSLCLSVSLSISRFHSFDRSLCSLYFPCSVERKKEKKNREG